MRGIVVGAAFVTIAIGIGCGFSFGEDDVEGAEPTTPRQRRSAPQIEDQTEETPAEGPVVTLPDAGAPSEAGANDAGGPLKAFVSSTLTTGNIGGLAGADELCNKAAAAAGLPGRYTAWLSTTTVDAIDRITATGPWQLVNGTEVAKDKADLVKGTLAKRFDKDEKGNTPPPEEDRVWTGTGPNGRFASSDCNGWGGTGGKGLVGEAEQTNGGWTSLVEEACTEVNRVYCLQQ